MTAEDPLDPITRSVSEGEDVNWELVESAADLDADVVLALKGVERMADFNRRLQRAGVTNDPAADAPSASTGQPPERWGHLMLLERIGAGAQGEVWRAWDASLQRQVALKFLLTADLAFDRAPSSDLVLEARALARIRHPGVVSVYGIAEHDQKTGMWMEWIEGITLAREIERRGALPAREVARIGLELCTALEALEGAGVVHRDVKPANVVVETGGRVVLTDFGLGWRPALDETRARGSGTPIFMAPELLSGGDPSPQSDLYALGVTLWWALAGRPPFQSRSVSELRVEAARGPSEPLRMARPGALPALTDAIEWAIRPAAAERPKSAALLAARLRPLVHDDPAAAPTARTTPKNLLVRAFSGRGAWLKIGLAALALAGLAGWIAVGLHTERGTRPFAWTARRLSVPANVTENDCSISPDGTKIAYLADSSAALMIFSIDSSDTRTVDRLPPGEGIYSNVGWSSDGSKLVASRCDALGNATVVLVDLITGHRDVLARLGALGPEQVHDLHASLSPHGDLLAVRRSYRPATGAFLELGVLDIRTGAERIVARGGENEFINPPIWAPTGARLAYVLTRGFEEYSRVETCDLRGKRTTVVEDSSSGLQPYGYAHPSLQWLDDHRLLYALRPGHHGDLGDAEWWSIQVDPATGQTSGEARQEYALPGAGVHSPSSSRDGHVAFTAERTVRQLGLIGTDGRARYPELTSGAQLGNLQFPVWSNDARRLFVRSDKNTARIAIGWLGLDDGRFEPLPTEINTRDRPLCLTSDDREVLCEVGSKLAAIRVADGVERVVADPFPGIVLRAARSGDWAAVEHLGSDFVVRDFSPGAGLGAVRFRYPANGLEESFPPTADLSPDGTRLVVLRPDAPGYDVLDAARGRLLRRIDLPSQSYPQSVRWSSDGTSLYATGLDGPANFWIARLGERGIDRLIWKSEKVWPGYLGISRDGTTLGFTSLEFDKELWLLQPR